MFIIEYSKLKTLWSVVNLSKVKSASWCIVYCLSCQHKDISQYWMKIFLGDFVIYDKGDRYLYLQFLTFICFVLHQKKRHNANLWCWREWGTLHLDYSHKLICEPKHVYSIVLHHKLLLCGLKCLISSLWTKQDLRIIYLDIYFVEVRPLSCLWL